MLWNWRTEHDYLVFEPILDDPNGKEIVKEVICPKGPQLCFKVVDKFLGDRYIYFGDRNRLSVTLKNRYIRVLVVDTMEEVALNIYELEKIHSKHELLFLNAFLMHSQLPT